MAATPDQAGGDPPSEPSAPGDESAAAYGRALKTWRKRRRRSPPPENTALQTTIPAVEAPEAVFSTTPARSGPIPGDYPLGYRQIRRIEDVDLSLRSDARFEALTQDPAHGGKAVPNTVREAMAILVTEGAGLVEAPVRRAEDGSYDFMDGKDRPIDVKAPKSLAKGEKGVFDVGSAARAVIKEIRTDPAAKDPAADPGKTVAVVLDTTYLTEADYRSLRDILHRELNDAERKQVIEVSVPKALYPYERPPSPRLSP